MKKTFGALSGAFQLLLPWLLVNEELYSTGSRALLKNPITQRRLVEFF